MDNHKSFNVGIVTVTYNSGKVIDEFLDSILSQAHQEYILYIIDNASSDDTLIRVAKYQDLRIVVIRNQDKDRKSVV